MPNQINNILLGLPAIAPAAPAIIRRLPPFRQLVGNRCAITGNNAFAGGGATNYTRGECRMKVTFGASAVSNVQAVFPGFYSPGGAEEAVNPNALTVEFGLENSASTRTYMAGFASAASAVVSPGGLLLSDPIGQDFDPNDFVYMRTGVVVPSTQRWPTNSGYIFSGEGAWASTGATSQIGATGTLANPGGTGAVSNFYHPMALIGLVDTPTPAVAMIGDSLFQGIGTGDSVGDALGNTGYVARGLYGGSLRIPHTKLSRGSDYIIHMAALASWRRRSILQYCTHLISGGGTNDISNGSTLASLQPYYLKLWASGKRRGLKVFQALVPPRTTSTDSWATAANQTAVSGFTVGGVRDQLNAWIKSQVGNGVLDGIIDPNPYLEDQANPGKWVTNGTAGYITADGTHPTAAGAALASQSVSSVARFWAA
jgi:hypothetical protein